MVIDNLIYHKEMIDIIQIKQVQMILYKDYNNKEIIIYNNKNKVDSILEIEYLFE